MNYDGIFHPAVYSSVIPTELFFKVASKIGNRQNKIIKATTAPIIDIADHL